MTHSNHRLRARQRLGKYRIEAKLSEGGFATVYRALDTIEGIRVAIKVPPPSLTDPEWLEDFRKEARTVAKLDHPNILPLKDASVIDGLFVLIFRLAEQTLAERLKKRISVTTALDYGQQMLEATAYAHHMRIVHCDIKPENLLLFPHGRLRLTDFGTAKIAMRTLRGSGTGTVGYMAPEQAMGHPSMRSDVFSLGLILYRMLAGQWPEWPYQWPPPGIQRLRQWAHPELIELVRKATDPIPRRRFTDAQAMLSAFQRTKPKALRYAATRAAKEKAKKGR